MRRKGTYVILITLDAGTEIRVGALGTFFFEKGTYCYVGSALGGLDARVRRHLRKDKILKWHADYLTSASSSMEAYISCPDYILECDLAHIAEESGMEPNVKGFGCSDCNCYTHLFKLKEGSLDSFLKRTKMVPFTDD